MHADTMSAERTAVCFSFVAKNKYRAVMLRTGAYFSCVQHYCGCYRTYTVAVTCHLQSLHTHAGQAVQLECTRDVNCFFFHVTVLFIADILNAYIHIYSH